MKTKLWIIIASGFWLLSSYQALSQINIGGQAYSFQHTLTSNVPEKSLPVPDFESIAKEDEEAQLNGAIPRFGFKHQVSLDLNNSGKWENLPNGDRIWRLRIQCPEAKSINLTYDHYWLPEGAKYYLYSPDKRQLLGGFTNYNNKGNDRSDKRGFATSFILGEEVILEYYEPAQVIGQGIISINGIVHGYKNIFRTKGGEDGEGGEEGGGESGECQVNVNCSPEGDNWQDEKKGIALIIAGGDKHCSGSLVNNSAGACTPNFLTACHCVNDCNSGSGTQLDDWMFMWEFESTGCEDEEITMAPTTSGATVRSKSGFTDFALLLLDENPALAGIDVYFNGWSLTSSPAQGGVGIHHPRGDLKKIATHNVTPSDASCHNSLGFWQVNWMETANGFGITEPVSSGSPLFMNNGLIIGQLQGPGTCGEIFCENPAKQKAVYGKFNGSWNNSSSTEFQLAFWLDFPSMDITELAGAYPPCSEDCVPFLILDDIDPGALSGVQTFQAVVGIQATNTINPDGDIDYHAGEWVQLNPGFNTKPGARFWAHIEDCINLLPPDEDPDTRSQTEGFEHTIKRTEDIIRLFPNPNDGLFELVLDDNQSIKMLEIYNSLGQRILVEDNLQGNQKLDLRNHSSGMYFLKIKLADNSTQVKKFIIK